MHTGKKVKLTLRPAPEDHGIVFCRADIRNRPKIKPSIDLVSDLVSNTTIASGNIKIHTIEHLMSALHGCGVDNVLVELDASEPPIMDGSAKNFVALIEEAQPIEQDKERHYFELKETVSVNSDHRSIIAMPYDGLRITCTSTDSRGNHTQHISLDIDPESYVSQIAPARTFTIYEEIEYLLKMGKIKGGSLESAIVIKDDKILTKEPLRFKEEFVRHKILDIIGDILLLGLPLKAHIIAVCPGHALNAQFTRALRQKYDALQNSRASTFTQAPSSETTDSAPETPKAFDIHHILKLLPHRYPFILVDRIIEVKSNDELVAVKNVSINEPYFTGHFPKRPVMPGVLQIEAMAQAAGVLMMMQLSEREGQIAYFVSCDKVKFRHAVEPGDQIKIHIKILKHRARKVAQVRGECRVDDKVVSSGEFMFTF